jgi:hypothetical protein
MAVLENALALVVGIAAYERVNPLPKAVLQDARDVHALLVDPQRCGYKPGNAQLLLDRQATQAALRKELASLAERCDSDSTVFLYVSSHGGRISAGKHAGEYLLPVDTLYTSDATLAETAISGQELTEALHAIPARKVVVVFDLCHSGGVGEPKDAISPTLQMGLPESYYDALRAGRGRVILASSRSTEVSWVIPGAFNSLFTQHLLGGLRGGVPSDDGLIRIFDLFEYLQPRVTAARTDQHPIFKANLEDNFPIALRQGGQKGGIARDVDGFRYDAYVSFSDKEPDRTWVKETLLARLKRARLRVALSGDVDEPGIARVLGVERAVEQSKRTLVVLSDNYVSDHWTEFENVLAQTAGIEEGSYRLLPVRIEPLDENSLPLRIRMLSMLKLMEPDTARREMERLVRALRGPLPRR